MKVVLIHNTIAPYRHPLFEALSKHVDLMVYYCSVKHSLREWDLWPRNYNYKYKFLPRIPIKTPIGEFSLNPSILKEIIKNKPKVIIISGYTDLTMWLAFAVAKMLKISTIYWTEGVREPQSILGMITRPFRTLFVKKFDAVVVPGRLSKRYVVSLGVDSEKVFIARNAIVNKLFITISNKFRSFKEELKGQIGLKGKVVILYVGRLTKEKGINFLLEAYMKLKRKISNIALLIVGYGELLDVLRKEKDDDIVLTGAVIKLKQLIKYYSMADIFVFPTLGDVWGFVINEAMACGLPVISTYASQAAVEMIRPGINGYIVKEANSEELYHTLKKLVLNEKLMIRMSHNSRSILRRCFSIDSMVSGFIQAISYALAKQRKHSLNR